MRKIELFTAFKKDYKRTRANPRHAQDVRALYEAAALLLAEDKPLPESYRDHALVGNWKGYRAYPSVLYRQSRKDSFSGQKTVKECLCAVRPGEASGAQAPGSAPARLQAGA